LCLLRRQLTTSHSPEKNAALRKYYDSLVAPSPATTINDGYGGGDAGANTSSAEDVNVEWLDTPSDIVRRAPHLTGVDLTVRPKGAAG
jgi:hypothetical protein